MRSAVATLNPLAGCTSGAAAPKPNVAAERYRRLSTGKCTRSEAASGPTSIPARARRASSRARSRAVGRPGRRASEVSSSSTRPAPSGMA